MPINTLFILIGVAFVQQLAILKTEYLIITASLLVFLLWQRYSKLSIMLAAIFWAMLFAQWRLIQQLPIELEEKEMTVEGVISNLPKQHERYIRFDFQVTRAIKGVPQTLRLNASNLPTQPKAGQCWLFTVKLKRPHASFNVDSFDYERYLFEQGIGATGSVRSNPPPVLLSQVIGSVPFTVLRQQLSDKLTENMTSDSSVALIKAVTLGDSQDMTQTHWDILRNTGTTHLLVISGSHIALIAGFVYLFIRKAWIYTNILKYSPHQIAAFIALFAGIFYALLSGFAVPIQRAVIMFSCMMFSVILKRNTNSLNTLCLAFIAVIIYDPLAILSIGCWLSFASVALIFYANAARLKPPSIIMATLKVHWFIFIGLMPILLACFTQISLLSPLANIIAVPVISFLVVPPALLALPFLYFAPAFASILLFIADKSLALLWQLLTYLADTPFLLTQVKPSLITLILTSIAVLLLLSPRGMINRWLALILLLPLFFNKQTSPVKNSLQLTLLDVGQGLAIALQTEHHWLIYDTGAKFSTENDNGTAVLIPFLQARGVKQLDNVIISHGDNDHIGGLNSLLKAIPTKQLLTSATDILKGDNVSACYAGQNYEYDGVSFNVLSPVQNSFNDSKNNHSCVVRVQTKYGSVLLTGDIEAETELDLVTRYGNALQADILIAPHHGSKSSSSMPFLQAVKPKIILISAGYRNSFGHPHAQVLARYQNIHAKYYNSAEEGALTVQFAESLKVQSARQIAGKYWNH